MQNWLVFVRIDQIEVLFWHHIKITYTFIIV